MSAPIIPGAEPISITGSQGGVLLLHGYTATPQQMRGWAMAFAQAGFAVEVPLLPGHGTVPDDLVDTQWADYLHCADTAYRRLAEHHQRVFVGGLCMGANLAGWMALLHPKTTAGVFVINGTFKSPRGGKPEIWEKLLKSGRKFFSWPTTPIFVNDPQAPALVSYDKIPIGPGFSVVEAYAQLRQRLGEISCPVLVLTSQHEWQEAPEDSIPWLQETAGPAQHIILERSNHVATLDYDKDIIETRSVEFAFAIIDGKLEQSRKEVSLASQEL